MRTLDTIQEAALGGAQYRGSEIMEFDFGHCAATVFPPDRLSPRWLIVSTGEDFWADSFQETMIALAIIAAN